MSANLIPAIREFSGCKVERLALNVLAIRFALRRDLSLGKLVNR